MNHVIGNYSQSRFSRLTRKIIKITDYKISSEIQFSNQLKKVTCVNKFKQFAGTIVNFIVFFGKNLVKLNVASFALLKENNSSELE